MQTQAALDEEALCKASGAWPVAHTRVGDCDNDNNLQFMQGYATVDGVKGVLTTALTTVEGMTFLYNVKDLLTPCKSVTAFAGVLEGALAKVSKSWTQDAADIFSSPALVMVNASRLPPASLKIIHDAVLETACKGAPRHRLVVGFYGMTWARTAKFCQEVLTDDFTCTPPHVRYDRSRSKPKQPSFTLFVSRTPVSKLGKKEIKRRDDGCVNRHHQPSLAVHYSDVNVLAETGEDGHCDLGLLDAIRCRTRPDEVVWTINDYGAALSSAATAAASLHCT